MGLFISSVCLCQTDSSHIKLFHFFKKKTIKEIKTNLDTNKINKVSIKKIDTSSISKVERKKDTVIFNQNYTPVFPKIDFDLRITLIKFNQ